ncbi:MAG: hypothetical protein RIS17_464 [Pseudomonadota bacterium]
MKIDTGRYAECASIAELAEKLQADLAPVVAGVHLLRNRVLVATYIRPEKTSGGIIRPDQLREEDKWQGKAGLVLKIGPSAFDFEEIDEEIEDELALARADHAHPDVADIARRAMNEHNVPQVGDWVFFRGSDTWDSGLQIAPGIGAHCRFIFDDAIIGRIEDPSTIW